MTTTRPLLEEQLESRLLTLEAPADAETTRQALRAQAMARNGARPQIDLAPWHAAMRWLWAAGSGEVKIEYAEWLAERVPAEPVTVRRAFEHFLTAIETLARLHQRQRQSDDKGRILATVADYAIARTLLHESFRGVLAEGVTKAVRRAVETVRELTAASDNTVSIAEVAKQLGVSKQAASRALSRWA